MKNIVSALLLLGIVIILFAAVITNQAQPAIETKGSQIYQQLQ